MKKNEKKNDKIKVPADMEKSILARQMKLSPERIAKILLINYKQAKNGIRRIVELN